LGKKKKKKKRAGHAEALGECGHCGLVPSLRSIETTTAMGAGREPFSAERPAATSAASSAGGQIGAMCRRPGQATGRMQHPGARVARTAALGRVDHDVRGILFFYYRHGRTCSAHPRVSLLAAEDVDVRDKPAQ